MQFSLLFLKKKKKKWNNGIIHLFFIYICLSTGVSMEIGLANVVFTLLHLKEKLPSLWCLFLTRVLLAESLEICAHGFFGTPFLCLSVPCAVWFTKYIKNYNICLKVNLVYCKVQTQTKSSYTAVFCLFSKSNFLVILFIVLFIFQLTITLYVKTEPQWLL